MRGVRAEVQIAQPSPDPGMRRGPQGETVERALDGARIAARQDCDATEVMRGELLDFGLGHAGSVPHASSQERRARTGRGSPFLRASRASSGVPSCPERCRVRGIQT